MAAITDITSSTTETPEHLSRWVQRWRDMVRIGQEGPSAYRLKSQVVTVRFVEPAELYWVRPLGFGPVFKKGFFYVQTNTNINPIPQAQWLTYTSTFQIEKEIEKALNWLVQNRITLPHPAEVRDYLRGHDDMTDLLLSVGNAARQRFGMDSQLSLEVYHDPEAEDEYLTLYVRQKNYGARILDTIEEICSQYQAELGESSGWLLITTDFSPPRQV